MKPTVPVRFALFFFTAVFITIQSFSQVSVQSTAGYSVNVNIYPTEVITTAKKCVNGYNYKLEFAYSVTFSGNNIPRNLDMLEGTITSNIDEHEFKLPRRQGAGTDRTLHNVWRDESDCATATVGSINLTQVTLEIKGLGISARTVSFPLVAALPVKLVNFSAEANQSSVKIRWTTATETNNDFFTVERSTDEQNWVAIRKIKGAGNSESLQSYEINDDAAVTGTGYYRIRQTDIDGKFSFSQIKTVKISDNKKSMYLFPVPNTGNTLNISGIPADYKNYDFALLNASGHILFSTTLTKASVELPSLGAGIYFIRVKNKVSGEATNLRYVKI